MLSPSTILLIEEGPEAHNLILLDWATHHRLIWRSIEVDFDVVTIFFFLKYYIFISLSIAPLTNWI